MPGRLLQGSNVHHSCKFLPWQRRPMHRLDGVSCHDITRSSAHLGMRSLKPSPVAPVAGVLQRETAPRVQRVPGKQRRAPKVQACRCARIRC